MTLDSIKALLIGTAIAFSGGVLRVLVSIQNKEKKQPWEHFITLVIVVIVGFTMSYLMNRAELHDKWYSTGILFVLGYGYDKFLKMITTNLPNWIDKAVNLFIENRYGASNIDRSSDEEEVKKDDMK
jgi:L-cystine uptake protein TcyP (sodium:dicarboxylate symporter family)